MISLITVGHRENKVQLKKKKEANFKVSFVDQREKLVNIVISPATTPKMVPLYQCLILRVTPVAD